MQAIFAKGNQRTINKIISLRKGALAENQYRVATRLHAIMLSIEKHPLRATVSSKKTLPLVFFC